MVMVIINIASITCLVTNDAWHAYDVIGVYKVHHGAGRVSYFTDPTNIVVDWYGLGRGRCP